MVFIKYNSDSLGALILATLCSSRSTRTFRSILYDQKLKKYKKESARIALSRLNEKKYVEKSDLGWSITQSGKKFLKNKTNQQLLSYIDSPFTKNQPNGMIVSFDIPEKNRKMRNWLRNQIKIFGYKMLQQSLWVGPGPLPLEFFKRLEKLGIRKNIKTFKIKSL